MIKAIDLFSGGGGVSIGLTHAGFKLSCALEIDSAAVKAYKGYHLLKDVNVIEGDICEISGDELLKTAGIDKNELYLLAGCPPCQKFSMQNRIHNSDEDKIEDVKKLLMQFKRIIQEVYPPFVLMENVPGIQSSYGGKILHEFLTDLDDSQRTLSHRYKIVCGIVNAADYGVPQLRKRFVLHAVRRDIYQEMENRGLKLTLPIATHSKDGKDGKQKWVTVKETFQGLPAINRSALPDDLILACHKKYSGHSDVYGIMDPDKPAPTMTGGCLSYSKGRFGHPFEDRAISVREAARLQTFPDDYIFGESLTKAALEIGNAVPIKLVEASGKVFYDIISSLKGIKERVTSNEL